MEQMYEEITRQHNIILNGTFNQYQKLHNDIVLLGVMNILLFIILIHVSIKNNPNIQHAVVIPSP